MSEMKERYQRLYEMAYLGQNGGLEFQTYSDHTPHHFHVEKDGDYEARVEIPTTIPQHFTDINVIGYKWQASKTNVVTNQDKRLILEWLLGMNQEARTQNYYFLRASWNSLNPSNLLPPLP